MAVEEFTLSRIESLIDYLAENKDKELIIYIDKQSDREQIFVADSEAEIEEHIKQYLIDNELTEEFPGGVDEYMEYMNIIEW